MKCAFIVSFPRALLHLPVVSLTDLTCSTTFSCGFAGIQRKSEYLHNFADIYRPTSVIPPATHDKSKYSILAFHATHEQSELESNYS